MAGECEAINQVGHNVVGPLLCFLNDLIECQSHGREHGRERAEFNSAARKRSVRAVLGSPDGDTSRLSRMEPNGVADRRLALGFGVTRRTGSLFSFYHPLSPVL